MSKKKKCLERGCKSAARCRGRCMPHYCKWWRENRLNDPDREPRCEICDGPHHAYDFCRTHYMAWWRWGDPLAKVPSPPKSCGVKGCTDKPRRDGHCNKHHQRILKYGDPNVVGKRGRKPKLLVIPQEIRSLNSAYTYSYARGVEPTAEMKDGARQYRRLRKELVAA